MHPPYPRPTSPRTSEGLPRDHEWKVSAKDSVHHVTNISRRISKGSISQNTGLSFRVRTRPIVVKTPTPSSLQGESRRAHGGWGSHRPSGSGKYNTQDPRVSRRYHTAEAPPSFLCLGEERRRGGRIPQDIFCLQPRHSTTGPPRQTRPGAGLRPSRLCEWSFRPARRRQERQCGLVQYRTNSAGGLDRRTGSRRPPVQVGSTSGPTPLLLSQHTPLAQPTHPSPPTPDSHRLPLFEWEQRSGLRLRG